MPCPEPGSCVPALREGRRDGDSTAPATSVPVTKKRQLDTSTVIAVVAVATAIAALVISILQVNVARSQNTAAQQQQLETTATRLSSDSELQRRFLGVEPLAS